MTEKGRHDARPSHFWKAFDLCLLGKFTKGQANVMARGFSKRGLVDACEGCLFYVLHFMGGIACTS